MPDSNAIPRARKKKEQEKRKKARKKKSQENRYREPACTRRAVMQSERMSGLLRGRLGSVYGCCCFRVEGGRFADTCEDTHAALVFGVDYGRKTGRGSSRGRRSKCARWCSPPVLRPIQALLRLYQGFFKALFQALLRQPKSILRRYSVNARSSTKLKRLYSRHC